MSKVMSSDTATRYRMGQYDTFRNPEKVQYLFNERYGFSSRRGGGVLSS
jgi:hypothetical protein